MIPALVNAIRNRRLVEVDYGGGIRVIEPHRLGRTRDDEVLLEGFQIRGASSSNPFDWKSLRLDRIRRLQLRPERFGGPRPDFKPTNRAMTHGVIASL